MVSRRPRGVALFSCGMLLGVLGCTSEEPLELKSWKDVASDAIGPLMFSQDTVYAARFDEAEFRALKRGMSKDEVHSKLGDPLKTWTSSGGSEWWAYSKHGTKSDNYHCRSLVFSSDGRLVGRHAEFYAD